MTGVQTCALPISIEGAANGIMATTGTVPTVSSGSEAGAPFVPGYFKNWPTSEKGSFTVAGYNNTAYRYVLGSDTDYLFNAVTDRAARATIDGKTIEDLLGGVGAGNVSGGGSSVTSAASKIMETILSPESFKNGLTQMNNNKWFDSGTPATQILTDTALAKIKALAPAGYAFSVYKSSDGSTYTLYFYPDSAKKGDTVTPIVYTVNGSSGEMTINENPNNITLNSKINNGQEYVSIAK